MSWLDAWRERAAAKLPGTLRDDELEMEIAYHLELETRRQIDAGYAPAEARARALERFGDPRRITDATRDARGTPIMEGGMQDLHWAVRSLRKSAGFSALALFTLALGIGSTTAAFTVLDTVLLRPLPYRHAERLAFIQERTAKSSLLPPSYPNFADWRDRARPFDAVASAMFPFAGTVWPSTAAAEPVRVAVMGVSRGFFATLGVEPVVGRELSASENAPGGPAAAMVSYEFWRNQMGSRQPLGLIRWGDDPIPVVGVLPPNFRFVTAADVYYGHERGPGTVRTAHNYMVVGRLKPGVTIDAARSEMTALSKTMRAEFGDATMAVDTDVQPLRDYLVGDYRVLLSIVFGAAAMVLLIACVNLLSAQLARGWTREHELVVRSALGASRSRLVRQLTLESVVLVAAGALLGVGLAFGLVSGVQRFGAGLLPRLSELSIDARSLGFVVVAAVITTLLVGIYPALRHSRGGADLALRGARGSGATVRASMWRALVGFEIALAMVLLVGSTLLVRTLHNILAADTGIDMHGVITASLTPRKEDFDRLEQTTRELAAMPGVSGVAFTSLLPFSWGNVSAPVRRPGDPVDRNWPAFAGFRVVSSGYFDVLKLHMVRGRPFTTADRAESAPVAVITQGIADKLWPGQDPLGKTIATNYIADRWMTVVGVAVEAAIWNQPRGSQNEIYVPLSQAWEHVEGHVVAVVRTDGDARALMPSIRSRLRQLAPTSPAQLSTLEERVEKTAADRRFAMLALTTFGIVALVLACVGIYGVVWYVVTTRTREIGIRMALGATARVVQRHILGGAIGMAGAGVVAGIVGGVFATRYLQASLYGVSRLDPWTYAGGGAITLLAALIGAYVPARRSSRVDPMIAIRAE